MVNRKGILLAGGAGTRLHPATIAISKQLLPVFDKPMIFYPLSTLMLAQIKDILIISTPEDIPRFKKLLKDGQQWGLNLSYAIQEKPEGIAQALIIGEEFLNGSPVALILGDNIFYGHELVKLLKKPFLKQNGATIFAYYVNQPQRYGVITFDEQGVVKNIEEKPVIPKSNYAITGLYFYDEKASSLAKSLKPSARGELEITDLNKAYLAKEELKVEIMGRGFAWLDTGTHESLLEAGQFIATIEKRQALKVACLEEIAYNQGWINKNNLIELALTMPQSEYSNYILNLTK